MVVLDGRAGPLPRFPRESAGASAGAESARRLAGRSSPGADHRISADTTSKRRRSVSAAQSADRFHPLGSLRGAGRAGVEDPSDADRRPLRPATLAGVLAAVAGAAGDV